MDEALEKAIEFSNFTVTLNTQKRILYEKYNTQLIVYSNGGRFTVTKELLNFCHLLAIKEVNKTVLIDDNNTPFEIPNVQEFLDIILQQYATATNTYLAEYKSLTKNRSVEGLVND
jgi:hypothetical protein|tara:strand:+ start:264 stop:611 length:348 start_codon:yes stop_codon:yes gene_type:complete